MLKEKYKCAPDKPAVYMASTHSAEQLAQIDSELNFRGVQSVRVCVDNDCYVCDVFGNFYKIPFHELASIYIMHRHCGYSLSELWRMHRCAHDTVKGVVKRIDGVFPSEVSYGY